MDGAIRGLSTSVDGSSVVHLRIRSGKSNDFDRFASICEAMVRGRHLDPDGLREIVRWAGDMNPSGKRGYTPESILQWLAEMKA